MRQTLWLTCIILPFLIELIISISIISLWFLIPVYILIKKGNNISYLDLIFFVSVACFWLYAIWNFFKHNISIPKTLFTPVKYFIFIHFILLIFPFYIISNSRNYLKNQIIYFTINIKSYLNKQVIFSISLIIILLVLMVQYKPKIEVNKLDTVKSRLAIVSPEVNDCIEESKTLSNVIFQFSNYKKNIDLFEKFSNAPQTDKLPQNRDGIEKLSKEYQNYLNKIKLYQMDVREKKNSIFSLKNAFKNSKKELIDIENQLKPLCLTEFYLAPVCLYLTEKIQALRVSIDSGSKLLIQSEHNLKSIENTLDRTDGFLVVWEQTIDEVLGRVNFNIDDVKNWLSEAENTSNKVNTNISKANKNILKAQEIAHKIKYLLANNSSKYTDSIEFYQQEISRLDSEISQLEQQSQSSVDVQNLLKTVKNNIITLDNLEKKITNFFTNIDSISLELKHDLNELRQTQYWVRQIANQGQKFSVYASNDAEGKNYVDIIITKNKAINELIQEKKTNNFIFKIESKLKQMSILNQKIKPFPISLKFRYQELNRKLEDTLFRANLLKIIILIIVLISLFFLISRQKEMKIIDSYKKLGKNRDDLLKTINNQQQFLKVRLEAVNILEEEFLWTQKEINEIKNFIRELEKSKNRSDRAVASRLRQVADSLELRLTEQRN